MNIAIVIELALILSTIVSIIGVALYNHSDDPYHVSVGDRVAQIVISPVCRAKVYVVEKFDDTTDRGTDGFGSTGV